MSAETPNEGIGRRSFMGAGASAAAALTPGPAVLAACGPEPGTGSKPSAGGAIPDDGPVLPMPPEPFDGKIGETYADSSPSKPVILDAPDGAPNILVVMLDDTGFGHASTFGGPVNTPTLRRLADEGLRYNRFHTTALCSPTRAALLTGRNHHSAHTGTIMELATGYPGYDGAIGRDTATVAETLRVRGYNTAAFGKWHNTPDYELSAAGPFDRWPTSLGFEYFYGFQGGEANQWHTPMYEGTTPIEPPDEPGWHFSEAIADRCMAWIAEQKAVAPAKPFFAYWAPGAPYACKRSWTTAARPVKSSAESCPFSRNSAVGCAAARALIGVRGEPVRRVSARPAHLHSSRRSAHQVRLGRSKAHSGG
jgi:Sulfatase